jgi:zinc protease
MKPRASALILSIGLCLSQAAFVQTCFAQTKVTSVEGITEYRLDNGLKILVFPDSTKPTVTVNVTYLVGSRHEGYGETGMAHLLEHMLFRGSTKHPDVKKEIHDHGANFNGTTSFDRTNYFETVTATDENVRWALEMESDRMIHSFISRQDLDSEMTVVRNEFERGENNNVRVLEERVLSTAYLWHNYGHSTIGSRSDIEKVPIDRLQAFYRNYYQPDNAVLIVAGKFDPAKTLPLIKETFGAIPKPERKLQETYTEEPVQDGEREIMLRRVGDIQAILLAYHGPAGSSEDSTPLQVLADILVDPPAGRLYKALVESKKATSVGGGHDQLHDPGYVELMAEVRKENSLDDVRKTMLDVIDGVVKEPPSKSEVDRIRTKMLKDFDLAFNNTQRVALQLSEWAAMGDWRLMFLDRDRIEKVTPEDVARVAKTYLKASNRTLGEFIPTENPDAGNPDKDRTVVPPPPNVSELLKNYTGKAALEEGEAFDPSPANIDARTVRVTLPNGMKLAMLQKKTRGGAVTATLALHYGDEKSVFGRIPAAQLAGAMLMRGTQKHTRQELQDALDNLKAQMNANAGATDANLTLNSVRANFPAALRLAAEVLKQPSFPENEFEQLRQASLARVENLRSEPQALAPNALNRHFTQYPSADPRGVTTYEEDIENYKKATLVEAKKFYGDFFGAAHAELAIVGDFDPAEVRKIAEEEFGNWKSPSAYAEVLRTYQKPESVNRMIETPDKTNAVFTAGIAMPLNEDDPDYPALVLANQMFGVGLTSRLGHRIREQDGLSYGVGSGFGAGVKSKYARIFVQAICAPQNVLKVEASFKDEVAKLLKDGFRDDEVAAAKKTYLDDRILGRSQDGGLARDLARNAQYGWTMQRPADLEQKITALTTAQLNATVRKYLDPASISYFKAGDFKKAGITQ